MVNKRQVPEMIPRDITPSSNQTGRFSVLTLRLMTGYKKYPGLEFS
jgi:hypothetical protein